MRLAWTTDIHLDCTDDATRAAQRLQADSYGCDGIIISGDISVATDIVFHLRVLEDALQKPIYFVLGNHDYYYSDIISTRKRVVDACRDMSFARYLGSTHCVKVDRSTFLVGSDGWYDAFNGDPGGSDFLMNDWLKIHDFQPAIRGSGRNRIINKEHVIQISRAICLASVQHIVRGIKEAAATAENIIVVTHVPPFVESYTDEKYKNLSAEHVVPWYTSKIMGEMLSTAAKTYPHVQFTILSGHTHSPFEGQVLGNVNVKVGKSLYGSPQIVGYIDI